MALRNLGGKGQGEKGDQDSLAEKEVERTLGARES